VKFILEDRSKLKVRLTKKSRRSTTDQRARDKVFMALDSSFRWPQGTYKVENLSQQSVLQIGLGTASVGNCRYRPKAIATGSKNFNLHNECIKNARGREDIGPTHSIEWLDPTPVQNRER